MNGATISQDEFAGGGYLGMPHWSRFCLLLTWVIRQVVANDDVARGLVDDSIFSANKVFGDNGAFDVGAEADLGFVLLEIAAAYEHCAASGVDRIEGSFFLVTSPMHECAVAETDSSCAFNNGVLVAGAPKCTVQKSYGTLMRILDHNHVRVVTMHGDEFAVGDKDGPRQRLLD